MITPTSSLKGRGGGNFEGEHDGEIVIQIFNGGVTGIGRSCASTERVGLSCGCGAQAKPGCLDRSRRVVT